MVPMTSPTLTVSPSAKRCSARTPAAGAGSATETLSVSRSTTGSSAPTVSPTFLSHFPITASEIDSPSLGITRSAIALYFRSLTDLRQLVHRRERLVDDVLLLHQVRFVRSRRRRGALLARHHVYAAMPGHLEQS